MKKTFKTTFSLLMVLVLALSLTATAFAQAAQPAAADIVYQGENKLIITPKKSNHTATDLFGNFKGMMPGDTRTETITFKNESNTPRTDYVKLYIVAVPHKADNLPVDSHITTTGTEEGAKPTADLAKMAEFLKNFSMTVTQGTGPNAKTVAGTATVTEIFGGQGYLLGTFKKGEGTTLNVELKMSEDAGNEFAAQEGEVDWRFVAEEYTTTPGGRRPGKPSVTPGTLIQTGQLNWPIAVLAAGGAVLIVLGWIVTKKKRHGNA